MVDENNFAALAPLAGWQRTEAAVLLRTVATFDTEYPLPSCPSPDDG